MTKEKVSRTNRIVVEMARKVVEVRESASLAFAIDDLKQALDEYDTALKQYIDKTIAREKRREFFRSKLKK